MKRRDERGQAGGVEAIAFGLLVFVVGTLIVANAWAVVDAKFAVSAAARHATRTYVETGRTGSDAEGPARDAALTTLHSLHRDRDARVAGVRGGFRRCGRVEIEVSTSVPVLRLPFVGAGGPAITVSGRHAELVDPYRSGVEGEAAC